MLHSLRVKPYLWLKCIQTLDHTWFTNRMANDLVQFCIQFFFFFLECIAFFRTMFKTKYKHYSCFFRSSRNSHLMKWHHLWFPQYLMFISFTFMFRIKFDRLKFQQKTFKLIKMKPFNDKYYSNDRLCSVWIAVSY